MKIAVLAHSKKTVGGGLPELRAELKRRGLMIRVTGNSFHVQDPEGLEVQMGGKEQ